MSFKNHVKHIKEGNLLKGNFDFHSPRTNNFLEPFLLFGMQGSIVFSISNPLEISSDFHLLTLHFFEGEANVSLHY